MERFHAFPLLLHLFVCSFSPIAIPRVASGFLFWTSRDSSVPTRQRVLPVWNGKRKKLNTICILYQAKNQNYVEDEDPVPNLLSGSSHDKLRRKMLLWGPAAFSSASILFSNPSSTDAYTYPNNPPHTGDDDGNSVIPYSSVRRYKLVCLSNGLRVMLVSDSQCPTASAALSIEGPGQFSDPSDLPGRAHLMEHMVLSYNSKVAFQKPRDFEEWLSDRDGASNAFTAYDTVCFHFSSVEASFAEALERFASLFRYDNIRKICRDENILRREVRRVDSELDFDDAFTQELYLTKGFVNPEHPFSKFSAGDASTLEILPKEAGIDVGERLESFFEQYYLPEKAVLVVISRQDIAALERFVVVFNNVLSVRRVNATAKLRKYPGGFLRGNRLKHLVLYNKRVDNNSNKLSFQWATDLDYNTADKNARGMVTATQLAFVLSQIVSRRGPGSLGYFLLRRGWCLNEAGIPKVSITVDVSGFQIIKMTMQLTPEGFRNRATIVSTFYNSLAALRKTEQMSLDRDFLSQCAAMAKLHGYTLAQRPPDSIELAIDSQFYGYGEGRSGSGDWYLFPNPDDESDIRHLQKSTNIFLEEILDPSNALIIGTTGNKEIFPDRTRNLLQKEKLSWKREAISGAEFFFEDMLKLSTGLESFLLSKAVVEDEFTPPVINPLIAVGNYRKNKESKKGKSNENKNALLESNWILLETRETEITLPMPRCPPERLGRTAFVIELLSSRPARANVRQAAQGELWKLSFENSVKDLAELGAPGGLAYDISFNEYGLRLTFLGMNRNIASYSRRFCRRLIAHHYDLLAGPELFPSSFSSRAIENAKRIRSLTQQRRLRIISNLRRTTAFEAATEGIAFLRSCTGAVCFAQGDFSRPEQEDLFGDIVSIFEGQLGPPQKYSTAYPLIEDLLYKPVWKPRYGSVCTIAGVPLVSNACGRIAR